MNSYNPERWIICSRVCIPYPSLQEESFTSPVNMKRETLEIELLFIRNISVTLKFKPLLVCLVGILRSVDVLGDTTCCHHWIIGGIGH